MRVTRGQLPLRHVIACLALAWLGGCSSTTSKARPKPIENEDVLRKHAQDLQRAEQLFLRGDAAYLSERERIRKLAPGLDAWLAKSIVGHAVQSYDRLPAQWRPIDRLRRLELSAKHRQGLLFRARAELVKLGPAGSQATIRYLLRDRRGQLRTLGRFLLEARPAAERVDLVRAELGAGNPQSKVEALRLLASLPATSQKAGGATNAANTAAEEVLAQTLGSSDWRLRGTAIRVRAERNKKQLAEAAARGGQPDPRVIAFFFERADKDSDVWVRKQALLALGDLGQMDAVRPLVAALEGFVKQRKLEEAGAAAQALSQLTGRRYGVAPTRWREWLDGKGD